MPQLWLWSRSPCVEIYPIKLQDWLLWYLKEACKVFIAQCATRCRNRFYELPAVCHSLDSAKEASIRLLPSTLLPRTFISNAPSVGALVNIPERQHHTKKTHSSPLIIHPENWAWSLRVLFFCLLILVSIIFFIRCWALLRTTGTLLLAWLWSFGMDIQFILGLRDMLFWLTTCPAGAETVKSWWDRRRTNSDWVGSRGKSNDTRSDRRHYWQIVRSGGDLW